MTGFWPPNARTARFPTPLAESRNAPKCILVAQADLVDIDALGNQPNSDESQVLQLGLGREIKGHFNFQAVGA